MSGVTGAGQRHWIDCGVTRWPLCGGTVSREALAGAVGVALFPRIAENGEVEPVQLGELMGINSQQKKKVRLFHFALLWPFGRHPSPRARQRRKRLCLSYSLIHPKLVFFHSVFPFPPPLLPFLYCEGVRSTAPLPCHSVKRHARNSPLNTAPPSSPPASSTRFPPVPLTPFVHSPGTLG